jgi:5-methyltetrahydrofolate--homocysteine methyltransferase
MSALLTTTMRAMEATIKALEEAGVRETVKVMVGGAPVTEAFADQIGADGYAPDAAGAADLAKVFVGAA